MWTLLLGAVVAAFGFACADSPVDPPQPWGGYDYQAVGFESGFFEIRPDGGTCELVRFDVGAWPCIITHVEWMQDSLAFRFAPIDTAAAYYYQHEGVVSERTIEGRWHLVAPTTMPYAVAGNFTAARRP